MKIGMIAGEIIKSLLILAVGGSLVFFTSIFAFLGMLPLYAAYIVPVIGGAGVLAITIFGSQLAGPKLKKITKAGFCCVLAGCVVYGIWGYYNENIAEMAERDNMLWKYGPFEEENLLVSLDEESSLEFTDEQAASLRLDGATALYPVYAAFVQATFPKGEYKVYDGTDDGYGKITCSGTTEAYQRLIQGKTDMIFAAGPSDDQLKKAKAAGVELHLTPIGREAFVFFVNSKNPVTGLTVEDVQGVYSGEITNWKELGGKNKKIRPFQRAENSGSQTALQRLMGDIPIIEPEKRDRIAGMGGIIKEVASYKNYENAIGFSFRYYSTEMVKNGDIRLLALNGVEPTKETIRDGSYPISNVFYAVTASPIGEPAPEETNENLGTLLQWILSEQGQELIEKTGYVSLH
ncbi:MAG: substrate-binding domain-containing protein [Firmicutes bacterium]|nr:substrate-binding domain-containing protein [Bacillota bacterium]